MTSSPKFQHVILTRYFVRFSHNVADVTAVTSPDRAWLDHRYEIFRSVCLPSVAAQTVQNFIWLLYFDIRTPEDYVERVRSLVSPHENIRIVLVDRFDEPHRAETIRAQLQSDTEWLLTSRLDNDDGWRRDFVETLQGTLTFERREFLNFPVGLIYHSGMTFLYRHPSNAFISLIEPVEGFLSVWCGQHLELSGVAPIRQLPDIPAFLQFAHARTRSNKPRGMRVHRLLALTGFEAMRLPSPHRGEESDLDLMVFNLTTGLAWVLRDLIVGIIRRLVRR